MKKQRLTPTQKLTESDHERIRAMADKGWKAGRIAVVIGKKQCTVYWFMLRNGLVEVDADKNRRDEPYMRAGRMVYPYSAEEDAFLEAQRSAGGTFKAIAAAATERFGKPRNHHSIFVRLTILAAAP